MLSFLYIVFLAIFIIIYVICCVFARFFTNKSVVNICCVSIIFLCYVFTVIYVYNQVGFDDWNFKNTLPTANVSPFMFATCPIFFILPKSIRKYFALLISLLSIGMFLSPIISSIYFFSIGYKFHPSFLPDYFAHFVLSFWGVYLVISKQVELKIKNSLIAGSIIVSVAIIMMILNVIFDKSFFGLSLNGKHTIYNNVIVSNSYLSALLYFTGLIVVLISGYFYQKLILSLKRKHSYSCVE